MRKRPKERRPPPIVAEIGALQKVQALAEQAGISLEDLADLLVDSGVLAMPPADPVTEKYTLNDLGRHLWGAMQAQPVSARARWFQTKLVEVQQRSLIVVLRDRGFSSHVIAHELGIDQAHVTRVYNQHADDLGAQVVGVRLQTIAGQMQLVAERAMQIEFQSGNGRAAWNIERERIGLMQSLGIVDAAAHKSAVEVTHRLDDATRIELQALVELEHKKAAQRASIRVIEAERFDQTPEELDTDTED